MPRWSLRLEQAESSRLAWAFTISLAVHLLIFGSYYAGKKYNLWENLHWPAGLQPIKMLADAFKKKVAPHPLPSQDVPLMFVEVNPAQASAEPPKDAKFYSDKNSVAANPDTKLDSNIPNITGTQKELVRTEDVPRKVFTPLQPTPPPQPAQEEQKPKPAVTPGDLAMAKPDLTPRQDTGDAPKPRPRTIQEARARLEQNNRLTGQKMKQEGGVRRHLDLSSVDAKATPFGSYDWALIQAVQQHWFSLLDQQAYAYDGQGKVVLQFTLHYDGRITEMSVSENTAGFKWGVICEQAVQEPAPFQPWPAEMRRMLGNTRNIQFTFYYN